MQAVTTIGLDIAKSVFQVHGVDAAGQVVILEASLRLGVFQKLPPCLVGIEACAPSHYWSRELQALGHTVKRQKNDMADAEAICEAVTRANMRFVPTKTPEQQSCLKLHRTRHLLIRQQTVVINSIRAHLAEFGIIAPVGRKGVTELIGFIALAGIIVRSSLLRCQASGPSRRLHGRTGAFRLELERVALVIDGAGPGAAGARSRIAVVLPLERHAKAFLHLAAFQRIHRLGLIFLHHFFHVALAHLGRGRRGSERSNGRREGAGDQCG
jgi:transposase